MLQALVRNSQTPIKTQIHKQTKRQTDRRQESSLVIWCILALKCDIWWQYFKLVIFLLIDWSNFVYLLIDFGIPCPSLKFLWIIALRPRIGWTPLTDTNDKQTMKQRNNKTGLLVCLFVCLYVILDEVWHIIPLQKTTAASATFSRRQDMLRSTDTQQFRGSKFQSCRLACVVQLATAPTTRHELRAFPA